MASGRNVVEIFLKRFYLFILRTRVHMCVSKGRGRSRGRERIPSRLDSTVITEPDARFHDPEIRT